MQFNRPMLVQIVSNLLLPTAISMKVTLLKWLLLVDMKVMSMLRFG